MERKLQKQLVQKDIVTSRYRLEDIGNPNWKDKSDVLSKWGHFYYIKILEFFLREPKKIQKQFYT